jgi:hypothetical protein
MFVVAITSSVCGILSFMLYVHIEKSKSYKSGNLNSKCGAMNEISMKELDA